MTDVPAPHRPVMLAEVIGALALRDGGVYIDATFGAGGYSAAILDAVACRVLAIERDPEACHRGEAILARFNRRLCLLQGKFGDLSEIAAPVACATSTASRSISVFRRYSWTCLSAAFHSG